MVLIGRLVADPQLRFTPNGISVANMRIAVDRPYATNQNGGQTADFIDVVVWRKLAETVAHNLSKGRLVGIRGRLQVRQYEWEGQKRTAAEVVADEVRFLDSRRDGSSGPAHVAPSASSSMGANVPLPPPPPDDYDAGPDDVPF